MPSFVCLGTPRKDGGEVMAQNEQIESWFLKYGDDVYRFLVYFTGSTDVEDMLQDTFLRALRSFETFRGESTPKTWLLKIARNLVVDQSRQHRFINADWHAMEEWPSHDKPVEDLVVEHDSVSRLMDTLQSLDEKYRSVLMLRCLHELSFKEISQMLGCNEITARSRFMRAKRQAETMLVNYRNGDAFA